MAGPFKVRLEDGMEVGPLDGEMLRSWYQQGLITRGSEIRAKGSKRWVRLSDTFDISDWGASGGSPSAKSGTQPEDLADSSGDDEGFEDAGPQTWRTYFACGLFFLLAAASGYFSLFPAQWLHPPGTPWREIALGFVVLGLLLVRGWEASRKLVRVLVLLLTLGLFPLAEVLIFRGVPWRSLIVLFPAVVMGFGLFFFLSGKHKPWPRVALNLFWVAVGAAGAVFLGAFPSPPVAAWMAAPSTLPAALAPAMLGAGSQGSVPATLPARPSAGEAEAPPAVVVEPSTPPLVVAASPGAAAGAPSAAAVLQEVPLLSPAAAEAVRQRAVFAPEDAFRRSYEMAGNGVAALSAPERRELGELMAAAYGTIPAADRRRLEAYMSGIRGGQISTSEQNREMSGLMRAAVLKLSAAPRARLQALYEKAVLAAR
jgi:hypothetical protein